MNARKKTPLRGRRLGRDAWILAARDALIEGGSEALKIGRLAKKLKAERGSFYHHFKGRDALLQELLEHWATTNSQAYNEALELEHGNGEAELAFINNMWLEESAFNPDYDAAVRDWARTDEEIAKTVRRVDRKRIDVLEQIFLNLGYRGDVALVRARVAYFHQVGYLALGLGESRRRRRELAPVYLDVLLGR